MDMCEIFVNDGVWGLIGKGQFVADDCIVNIKVKKIHPAAMPPKYATDGSMGMDVIAVSKTYIKECDCWEYDTKLAFELPVNYGMLLCPRSSNTKTDWYIPNSPGIIDSDYRGTVKVRFKHRNKHWWNKWFPKKCPYEIGHRVAQLFVIPYPKIQLEFTNYLSKTQRGAGSHGSTGK